MATSLVFHLKKKTPFFSFFPQKLKREYEKKKQNFHPTFDEYISTLSDLGKVIMSGLALGLHLPSSYFEPFTNDSFWIQRTLYYPPLNSKDQIIKREDGGDDETQWGIGCGEHTDYGRAHPLSPRVVMCTVHVFFCTVHFLWRHPFFCEQRLAPCIYLYGPHTQAV